MGSFLSSRCRESPQEEVHSMHYCPDQHLVVLSFPWSHLASPSPFLL